MPPPRTIRPVRRTPALPEYAIGDGVQRLTVRRNAMARAARLRIDARDGTVRLVLPARAPLAPALAWAETQRDWIEAQLRLVAPPAPLAAGAILPLDGRELRIVATGGRGGVAIVDGALHVGGPAESLSPRLLRWLRTHALATLTRETHGYAAAAGVAVGRIGVGDARSRWGSCSSVGDIRFSWRLILAPPEVRRAVVAHEVAHRLHMDHGPAFHAAVARLFGRDPGPERAWLGAHGAALHRIGRTAG